jgi:flagellar basal-body rod protein FlgB
MPVQPISLFDLASQQARWLSVRQSAVAGNIANADTPGYKAVEVEPFQSVLKDKRVSMATTQPRHLVTGATQAAFSVKEIENQVAATPSKNTVVLEEELMKSGDVRRSFELNTAIVKSFHRMLLMVSKS